jgi:hypothetical protein
MSAAAVSSTRTWERRRWGRLAERLQVAGLTLGYLVLLHLIYVQLIVPIWRLYGFTYHPPAAQPFAIAWLLALVPCAFMPRHVTRPSMLIYWAMYLLVYIPASVMPLYVQALPVPRALTVPLMLLPFMVIIRLAYLVPVARLPRIRVPEWVAIGVPLVLCLGTAAATARNISLDIFSLTLVYSLREEWSGELGGIMGYLFIWQANVVGPLLVVIGLAKGRPSLVALGFLSNVALFATSGLKSVLFSPIGAAAIWVGMAKLRRARAPQLLALIVAGLALMYVVDALVMEPLFGRGAVASVFIRRITYVPGILTGRYIDYFSTHPDTLFTDSRIFAWTGEYPYEQSVGKVIGYRYGNNPDQNAVANFWGAGYAGMGWLGMLFITLQFVIVLWLTDSVSRGHPLAGVAGLLVTPIFSLTNTALWVALLTWGLGLTLLILYLLPRTVFRRGPPRKLVLSRPRARGRLVGPRRSAGPASSVL